MANINLLPWREELRRQKTVEYAALLGVIALGAVLIILAGRFHANHLANYHKARNQYLQNEIDILNSKLQEIKELEATKQSLLARMNIIQELQRSRPEVVHLFEELVTTIPDGVWLNSIKQSGKTLQIDGTADSQARVSSYMLNLKASEWLKNPQFIGIQADKDKSSEKNFKLSLQQESLNAEEEG